MIKKFKKLWFKARARDAVGNVTVCGETEFSRQYRWVKGSGSCSTTNNNTAVQSGWTYTSGYGTWQDSNPGTSPCQSNILTSCQQGGLYTCSCTYNCSIESRFIKLY